MTFKLRNHVSAVLHFIWLATCIILLMLYLHFIWLAHCEIFLLLFLDYMLLPPAESCFCSFTLYVAHSLGKPFPTVFTLPVAHTGFSCTSGQPIKYVTSKGREGSTKISRSVLGGKKHFCTVDHVGVWIILRIFCRDVKICR